jgi:hypothetical protein
MKAAMILSLLILAPTGYAANAAPSDPYTDIDVVSVTPRSPDVKPFVLAVFTKEQLQRAAAALKKNSPTATGR